MMKRVVRGAISAPIAVGSPLNKGQTVRKYNRSGYSSLNYTETHAHIIGGNAMYNEGSPNSQTDGRSQQQFEEEHNLFAVVFSGDVTKVKEYLNDHPDVNVNCRNFQGRTPLVVAVKNKCRDVVELLLKIEGILVGDALLHAVDSDSVPMVQMVLAADPNIAKVNAFTESTDEAQSSHDFCSDMTALMLAAHKRNYVIIRILLNAGHRIVKPHLPDCFCREQCKALRNSETLSQSRIRLHAYRAFVCPEYICQTSSDPILTAFKLSNELKHVAGAEKEFNIEYVNLAKSVSKFAEDLLAQCRTTNETLAILNRKEGNPRSLIRPDWKFARVGLAIDGEHKGFISQSNCQQVLRSAWIEGWPDWKRMGLLAKMAMILPRIAMLPVLALLYFLLPSCSYVQVWRSPLNKFLSFVAAYVMFLGLLLMQNILDSYNPKRGKPETGLEIFIILYIVGYGWKVIKTIWIYGMAWFLRHKWNIYDSLMLLLFYMSFGCWAASGLIASLKPVPTRDSRHLWNTYDPTVIGEACYAIAVLLAFGKLMFFCQTGDGLGSLQISMSQMFCDVSRFIGIFVIIMFAFAIGLYKLYHYYAGRVRTEENGEMIEQLDNFRSVTRAFISLYWAIYGYGDPKTEASFVVSEEVTMENNVTTVTYDNHEFTEAVGQIMFAAYHVICIIMLINMLIAMMSSTFLRVQSKADKEWKFNRTKVWMTFFQNGDTLPPPFNIIPTTKLFVRISKWISYRLRRSKAAMFNWYICCYLDKSKDENYEQLHYVDNDETYELILNDLVQRYLVSEEKMAEEQQISIEDLEELCSEIRNFKQEFIKSLLDQKSRCEFKHGERSDQRVYDTTVVTEELGSDY